MSHGSWGMVMGRLDRVAENRTLSTENDTADTPAGRLVLGAILLRNCEMMRGAGEGVFSALIDPPTDDAQSERWRGVRTGEDGCSAVMGGRGARTAHKPPQIARFQGIRGSVGGCSAPMGGQQGRSALFRGAGEGAEPTTTNHPQPRPISALRAIHHAPPPACRPPRWGGRGRSATKKRKNASACRGTHFFFFVVRLPDHRRYTENF